jgi:hypothetical protein
MGKDERCLNPNTQFKSGGLPARADAAPLKGGRGRLSKRLDCSLSETIPGLSSAKSSD